nr:hypothetical protein [Ectobacillus panaciterrae]
MKKLISNNIEEITRSKELMDQVDEKVEYNIMEERGHDQRQTIHHSYSRLYRIRYKSFLYKNNK